MNYPYDKPMAAPGVVDAEIFRRDVRAQRPSVINPGNASARSLGRCR